MLLALLSLLSAHAGDAFVLRGESNGCRLYLGQTEPDGVIPMRAECDWDVPAPALEGIIGDVQGHSAVFSRVTDVRILEGGEGSGRLWHHHAVPIVADREVEIRWERQRVGELTRWRWWTMTPTVPLSSGSAHCRRWEGVWEVRASEDGGAHVVHENYYDPGNFPAWLLRPFLAGELGGVMDEVRQAALGGKA